MSQHHIFLYLENLPIPYCPLKTQWHTWEFKIRKENINKYGKYNEQRLAHNINLKAKQQNSIVQLISPHFVAGVQAMHTFCGLAGTLFGFKEYIYMLLLASISLIRVLTDVILANNSRMSQAPQNCHGSDLH